MSTVLKEFQKKYERFKMSLQQKRAVVSAMQKMKKIEPVKQLQAERERVKAEEIYDKARFEYVQQLQDALKYFDWKFLMKFVQFLDEQKNLYGRCNPLFALSLCMRSRFAAAQLADCAFCSVR
jgi:hypothetical protein